MQGTRQRWASEDTSKVGCGVVCRYRKVGWASLHSENGLGLTLRVHQIKPQFLYNWSIAFGGLSQCNYRRKYHGT